MKPIPARQVFQRFFGLGRRETISNFLYTILISAIIVDSIVIVLRLFATQTFISRTTWVLIGLLILQFILLFMVKRGYVDQAAFALVIVSWVVITFLIGTSDGVRDVAVYIYILIILVSALLTNWRISILLSVLSVAAIWVFAIAEWQGIRTPEIYPPLNMARDLTAIFVLLVVLIYLVVKNVTSSLDAVREGEEKYRNFIEQSIEGIWYLSFDQPIPVDLPAEEQVELIYRNGFIAESNDVLAQMYGYPSSAEIQGVRLLDLQEGGLLDPINYQSTLKLVNEHYRSGNRETREVNRHGETVYFLNNALGIVKDGFLTGLWGTQLDITALKKAEEALRRSEARMRALLKAIPDMIFEFSQDGRILQFIPSANNKPLYPPEQFIGKFIGDVLPELADQTMFSINRALESGHVHAFQYDLLQDDKHRTFEARLTPLGSDTVLAMVRDVSLQKWIEGERENLIVELEEKNAELERFTYTVSHDLKSPLITIQGFLGFVREDSRSGNLTRLESDIQRISAATEKMQSLLNDLLELSRVGRLVNQQREIVFHDLVRETVELLHGRISQAGVAVSIADDLPLIHGDYERLVEVMQNLIDNACKFMGDQPAPRVDIGHQGMHENMPVFYVRDNGVGIAPEFHERIFGLFNKLDVRSDGTGVGLALVRRIVEFHGGTIWVESKPGEGTTFFFTLPAGGKKRDIFPESP